MHVTDYEASASAKSKLLRAVDKLNDKKFGILNAAKGAAQKKKQDEEERKGYLAGDEAIQVLRWV